MSARTPSMYRFAYSLTVEEERRCAKNEFYLQQSPKYKGYTEKIFKALYTKEPLTMEEISQYTGIDKRSINGVLSFNITAGYMRRIPL